MKKIPKIIFRTSLLYNKKLKREQRFIDLNIKIVERYTKKIEKQWRKVELDILSEIAKVTKLKWNEKEIVCYIVDGVSPYSDPLTINLRSDIDTITHELIHRILSEPENPKISSKNWAKVLRDYKKETRVTKVHIGIHSIHAAVIINLFGAKRLNHEKSKSLEPEYHRSWEIVDAVGYENIISDLFGGKKKYELRLGNLEINEGDTLVFEEEDSITGGVTGRSVEKK